MSSSQLQKAEGVIKSGRLKSIYKEKAKRASRRRWGGGQLELEAKLSSKTHICEEDEQEVSQYLSIWEEH